MRPDIVSMPRLSIVIVSHNSRADLDACLQSLAAAPPDLDHEIVIVDSGSTDGTPQYLRQRWPGMRLIDAGGNVGFATANNIGVRQTYGELVLFLNPDTIVPRGAVDALAGVLAREHEAAIVGPRLIDGNGYPELSFGRMISPLAELRQKVLVTASDRRLPILSSLVARMTRRSRRVDWVSGACMLVRRGDLESVGLFDERFFLYTEDVDLCASVRARGRLVLFCADVEVVHLRGRSGATAPRQTADAYRRSRIAFYDKHHPRWTPVLRAYLKLTGR